MLLAESVTESDVSSTLRLIYLIRSVLPFIDWQKYKTLG
ncbi:hypothetical protein EVA_01502 [gut metagenome]|uniref:Uncharacterized protein n=1 Tax=gut metagenome TaxID=749906 RepID=J9H311_9ZZZZ